MSYIEVGLLRGSKFFPIKSLYKENVCQSQRSHELLNVKTSSEKRIYQMLKSRNGKSTGYINCVKNPRALYVEGDSGIFYSKSHITKIMSFGKVWIGLIRKSELSSKHLYFFNYEFL